MSDGYCVPGTERDFFSLHMMLTEEWLLKALEHARKQDGKVCSLVVAIKTATCEYKVCDGIGGLGVFTGVGDWEPVIRKEFSK